jgi:hypothetical protein
MEPPPKLPVKTEKQRKLFLHKLSGLWVFLVDNAFFGVTVATAIPTGGFSLLITCSLASLSGGLGVFLIQKMINGDSLRQALNKALLAGVLSGIPTSLAGTIYGAWVLRMAGLSKKDIPIEEPPIDVQSTTSQDDSRSSH